MLILVLDSELHKTDCCLAACQNHDAAVTHHVAVTHTINQISLYTDESCYMLLSHRYNLININGIYWYLYGTYLALSMGTGFTGAKLRHKQIKVKSWDCLKQLLQITSDHLSFLPKSIMLFIKQTSLLC